MSITAPIDQQTRLSHDRFLLMLLGVVCLAMVGGALYMQYYRGEDPCPLCILQRYAYLLVAVFAFIGAATRTPAGRVLFKILAILAALGGIGAAGRHVYVLARPMFSCGFDALEPIVDALPPAKWLPSVFKVAGLCETPYPPILGLSLPAWSLIGFALIVLFVGGNLLRRKA